MGYELKKVMRLYGVDTPSMARYAGVAKPVEVAELKDDATAEQRAQYEKDKAAFEEQMRRYDIDQAAYKGYTDAYGRNVGMGSIYNQGQFGFTGQQPAFETLQAPVYSTAADATAGGTGAGGTGAGGFDYDAFAKANLPTWFRPDVYAKAVEGLQSGVNFGDYDITGKGTKGTLAINYGDFSIPTGFRDSRDIRAHADALRDMYNIYTKQPYSQPVGVQLNNQATIAQPNVESVTMQPNAVSDAELEWAKLKPQMTYARGGDVQAYRLGGRQGDGITMRRIEDDPVLERAAGAIDRARAAERDVAPITIEDPFARENDLRAMLEAYAPQADYSGQLAEAEARRKAEFDAFAEMIKGQASPEADRASKAEMYFRLAAAFGAPTRTGSFGENLALASGELAEVAAGKRKSAADRFARELELQKTRMEVAGSEVDALRSAARSGAADQRAIAEKLIEQSLAAGKPQSSAGKEAVDMGFTPGTPEYNAKVAELTELRMQRELAALEGQLLAQQRMPPALINLKSETEDKISSVTQAMADVKEAFELNPNSFSGGALDQLQYIPLAALGSDAPKVVNTRRIENLLGEQALGRLKTTFGAAPTEGERKILMDLQGIGAKSLEERAEIMLRLYDVLDQRRERELKKLREITSGQYGVYQPEEGEE